MNLNPIYVTVFDQDGWPLCPKCDGHLQAVGMPTIPGSFLSGPGKTPYDLILPILMRQSLKCPNCEWLTPTELDPKLTFNLIQVRSIDLATKWGRMTQALPRIRITRYRFVALSPQVHDWAMWFGVN